MSDNRKIYRVGELTRLIKTALEKTFGEVWVQGEVSNVRRPSSGHIYFTIKDESAQISAVMFRGSQGRLKAPLTDGALVVAFGLISVYERSGAYQIVVRELEEAGKGSLHAAFEALKKKLQAEGLFAVERKKPLPLLPRHIGIVTSPTGAAIRDILKVLAGRFPNLHVMLAPVKVQGEGAAAEIAAAIEMLNRLGKADVMIVGRGGGSLEDLWAFNEEIVARAIAASKIPVISAVGHETDFTISDFVADLRAPTPSAAAERVVACKETLERQVTEMRRRLARAVQESVFSARHRLMVAAGSRVFAEPRDMVRQYARRMGEIWLRIRHSTQDALRETQQRVDDAGQRRVNALDRSVEAGRQDIKRLIAQLRALSPVSVLVRGYSITRGEDGRILRDASQVRAGQRVRTRLAAGEFESEVVETAAGSGRKEVRQ